MRARLRADLSTAIKGRDRVAIAALRTALAAIDNAEAVDPEAGAKPETSSAHIAGASAGAGSSDVMRRTLTEADMREIVRRQVDERSAAADEYERLGRADQANELRQEAAVLRAYLTTPA